MKSITRTTWIAHIMKKSQSLSDASSRPEVQMNEIKQVAPAFGKNYKPGYVGFTYHDDEFVSRGISYFTRWARLSDIRVSHCFVVACKNDLVEAHIKPGVIIDHIAKYFDDPHCHVFFRKPVGWTPRLGHDIVYTAMAEVGTKYDVPLIIAHMLQAMLVGKALNRIFRGKLDRAISRTLNHPRRWICSELAAHCLQEQEALRDKGVLKDPACIVDPQELFEDNEVFEPWKQGESHE